MPKPIYIAPPDKHSADHPDHWEDAHFSTSDGIRVGRVFSLPKSPATRLLFFCGLKSAAKDYDHPHLDHLTNHGALIELIPMPDSAVHNFSHEDNKLILRETIQQQHIYSDLPTAIAVHSLNGLALYDSLREERFLDLLDEHNIKKLIFLAPYMGSEHLQSAWKPFFYAVYARLFSEHLVGKAPLDRIEKGFAKELDEDDAPMPRNMYHKHALLAVEKAIEIMEEIKSQDHPFPERVFDLDITCIAGEKDSVSYKDYVKEAADLIGADFMTFDSGHCPLTESPETAEFILGKLKEIEDMALQRMAKNLRRSLRKALGNSKLQPETILGLAP